MSAPRSSTDPPLAAAVPRPGRAPRPANVPGPLPRPIWSASAPRRAGCGSSRGRASCARRPHRSRQLLACAISVRRLVPKVRPPAHPPDARPLQRTLARQSTAPFIETLGPPPCTWPAAHCSSSLTATFRHCVRRAASCCRRRVLPASCGRSPALPLALAAPVLNMFLFLCGRSCGQCE